MGTRSPGRRSSAGRVQEAAGSRHPEVHRVPRPELPFLEKPVGFGRLYELLGELLGVVGGPPSGPRHTTPARSRVSKSVSG